MFLLWSSAIRICWVLKRDSVRRYKSTEHTDTFKNAFLSGILQRRELLVWGRERGCLGLPVVPRCHCRLLGDGTDVLWRLREVPSPDWHNSVPVKLVVKKNQHGMVWLGAAYGFVSRCRNRCCFYDLITKVSSPQSIQLLKYSAWNHTFQHAECMFTYRHSFCLMTVVYDNNTKDNISPRAAVAQ